MIYETFFLCTCCKYLEWLPNSVVNASMVIAFKAQLDKFWVIVYNDSAPGNQHFCELLLRANDVINIYI